VSACVLAWVPASHSTDIRLCTVVICTITFNSLYYLYCLIHLSLTAYNTTAEHLTIVRDGRIASRVLDL